ncbi:MarR family transcriptional regulator [Photobacterium profundum]|nr:MarR family transcriptional regulator [Photobacterium profundum]
MRTFVCLICYQDHITDSQGVSRKWDNKRFDIEHIPHTIQQKYKGICNMNADDPKHFDSIIGKSWMAMKLLQNQMQAVIQKKHPFMNIEQFQLLLELKHDDGVRPSELAYRMQRTKSTISSLLRHAERSELIASSPDPKHKNAKKVYLTMKGHRVYADIAPIVDKELLDSTDGISEADQAIVAKAMEHIIEKINPEWLHDEW